MGSEIHILNLKIENWGKYQILNSKIIKNLGIYRKCEKWPSYFQIQTIKKKIAYFFILDTTKGTFKHVSTSSKSTRETLY